MEPQSTDAVMKFLRDDTGRPDLARLLRFSTYDIQQEEAWSGVYGEAFVVSSPKVCTDALTGLPEHDQKRVFESLRAVADLGSGFYDPTRVVFAQNSDVVSIPKMDALFAEVVAHRNQMIAVATRGMTIQNVNDYYKARHKRITKALSEMSIAHPNPHTDLWDFYRAWKDTMGSWAERRRYVNNLYEPLIDQLIELELPDAVEIPEPTGWERVDRAISKAKAQLSSAKHEEDFQHVGLLCREVLISLGQAVYDPTVHSSVDGIQPSPTDAGRTIEAFIAHVAAGSSNENVRRHVRTSLKLAVELQHGRNADFRDAALCLEATSSVTNSVAILAGRRDSV